MLRTLDGKHITRVPHTTDFDAVLHRLGTQRSTEVRAHLNAVVDGIPPDPKTGRRTFSSSHLGSALSPWQPPLKHLYDVSCEIEGKDAEDEAIESRAALIFGLFIWECIMGREEEWVFYDPNLDSRDPNREITGKVYFEQ